MQRRTQRLCAALASTVVSLALAGWIVHRFVDRRPVAAVPAPVTGELQLYVLGGSTAAGAPYAPVCDVGQLVHYLFAGEVAGRRIQVVNTAGSGDDTARALESARRIASVRHERDAAIAVLYSGDNEFLKFIDPRLSKLGERRLFDVPLVSPSKREEVMSTYVTEVEEIARTLSAANVPLVVCTGMINVADREPNRSVLDDASHDAALRASLDQAETSLARGDAAAALAELDRALALEPRFAWANKRRGDALRRLGRFDEAYGAYRSAVDFDQAPISFTPAQNEALRALAQRLDLALVDGEALVRAASRDGLPGYDVFWDTCHPKMSGFLALASGVASVLEERTHARRKRASPALADVEAAFPIQGERWTALLIGRAQYIYGSALLTWDPAPRLKRAHELLDEARERAPNDAVLMCSQAVLLLIEGDLAHSRAEWKRAFALDPQAARVRAGHPSVQWLLRQHGIEDPEALFGT